MNTNVLACSFRIAQPGDAQQIQSLYFELVKDPNIKVTPDSIAGIAKDKFNILIGQVVATAFMTICKVVMYNDQPFAVVENVVVASAPGLRHRYSADGLD